MDDEGFLVIGDSRLIPHEIEPNIFVTDQGVVAEMLDDSFIYNNMLYTKVENVVDFFANIVDNEPDHRTGLP